MKIGDRLRLTLLLASTTVIVFACGVFIAFSVFTRRQAAADTLQTLAAVMARNCDAALAFGIAEDAEVMLASLSAIPAVMLARIYDEDGLVFAEYRTAEALVPEPLATPAPDGHGARDGLLLATEPILMGGNPLGTLTIVSDQRVFRAALHRDITLLAALMLVSVGLAYILASRLQRVISTPILALTDAAKTVTGAGDYSIRVRQHRDDEIGVLAAAFNSMLGEIQRREGEVRQARDGLEAKVKERTRQLEERTGTLERFTRAAVGREHRMIDLKKRINTLAAELGQDEPYDLSFLRHEE